MTLSLFAIFGAGLLTFASPCILPLLPVYLALLGGASAAPGERSPSAARAVAAALAFSVGLALVFVGLGLAASAAGKALVAHRTLLLQLGGLAVFLFGLKLLGALQVPWLDREVRGALAPRGGLAGAFVLGATFGLGWTPCIGPVLGSVLTLAAAQTGDPWSAATLLAAYAAGLGLPLVAAAAAAPLALRLLKSMRALMRPLQLATGALLAAVGLLLLTDHLALLEPASLASPPALATRAAAQVGPAPRDDQGPIAQAPGRDASPASCGVEASAAGACALPHSPLAFGPAAELPAGPAMVEFVSRVCPVCLRMAPVVAAAERGCAGKRVEVRRIEVDAPGGLALSRRFGVLGVPTFLFIDARGEEVARLVGEQPLSLLEQSLSVLAGEECGGFRPFPEAPPAPRARREGDS